MINWHRLFGVTLIDFFSHSPYQVELEKDLSLKQQFLDIVIIRKQHSHLSGLLPDGFENLGEHNLISYKSLHEPFDGWAVKELMAHAVNYRKQSGPDRHHRLPKQSLQLYGVTTRYPEKLANRLTLEKLKAGVYQIRYGLDDLRLIVLSQVSRAEHNNIWHLFSANADTVAQALEHYRVQSTDNSTILTQLYEKYQQEGVIMPYTMKNFHHDYTKDHLHLLTDEERLQGITTAKRLKGIATDERLKGIATDERLKDLPLEEIKAWLVKHSGSER